MAPRLVLLLIAIAHLLIATAHFGTDITRLVLDQSAPSANHESIAIPMRPGQREAPRSVPDIHQPDAAQKPDTERKPDTVQKKVELRGDPGAVRGAPRGPRGFGTAGARLFQLPPDFSTNGAPWCLACRQPMRRYVDRRRVHDW